MNFGIKRMNSWIGDNVCILKMVGLGWMGQENIVMGYVLALRRRK